MPKTTVALSWKRIRRLPTGSKPQAVARTLLLISKNQNKFQSSAGGVESGAPSK